MATAAPTTAERSPTASMVERLRPSAAVRIVALDFERKSQWSCSPDEAPAVHEAGHLLWVDVDCTDADEARRVLTELGGIEQPTIDDALTKEPSTVLARYDHYLHLVVAGCRQRGTDFELERIDVVVAEGLFVTIHRGPVLVLDAVQREYRFDFVRFARTPSFLVYELWDQLIENYLGIQAAMEERVEELQTKLRGSADEETFARLSALGADLLHFRKVLLPARAVLADLATRRSPFVSEITQPFLANLLGKVEHVLQDLLVDRDILSESLNLYMSLVSYRTNEVMKRLTVVSVVFLPLTFICGIYGMNFEVLPELRWPLGYLFFWVLVAIVVGGLLFVMKRARIL